MTSRGTVVAGLVGLQICVVVFAVIAVMGGVPAPSSALWTFGRHVAGHELASGPELAVGGAHRVFDTSGHPSLQVDIGYADVTILAGTPGSKVDVSLGGDADDFPFGSNGAIWVKRDGDSIRVGKTSSRWSSGDDRRVTVVVPPDTQIDVVNAGVIKATGLRAVASLSSIGNGSVTVDDFDGPSLTATTRGRVLLQHVVAEHLDVKSRDDSVEGSGLRVRNGTIESDDHASLGFVAGSDTLITADASDGKILASGFTGNDSDASAKKLDDDDASTQTLKIGSGTGRLEVHAGDGNIVLTQES
jgi:hypothetical protein